MVAANHGVAKKKEHSQLPCRFGVVRLLERMFVPVGLFSLTTTASYFTFLFILFFTIHHILVNAVGYNTIVPLV